MKRTDLQDTSAWAHKIMVERFRRMTRGERIQIALERSEEMRRFRRQTRHLRP